MTKTGFDHYFELDWKCFQPLSASKNCFTDICNTRYWITLKTPNNIWLKPLQQELLVSWQNWKTRGLASLGTRKTTSSILTLKVLWLPSSRQKYWLGTCQNVLNRNTDYMVDYMKICTKQKYWLHGNMYSTEILTTWKYVLDRNTEYMKICTWQ